MRAEDKSFSFMATPSYYDIPFFQRAYVWSEDNWGELLSNLTSKSQSHFLGSIILKDELTTAGNNSRFFIIDGQQRLTTLSVLLRACYDHLIKNAYHYGYDDDTMKTCQVMMENLLFVSEGGIKKKLHIKINHSYLDKEAFEKVISGNLAEDSQWKKYLVSTDGNKTNGIIRAYAFFRKELLSYSLDTIDYLWGVLTANRIKFLVSINLEAADNEQAIFDTVNSSGVRLSAADTIKNLLFQKYVELLRYSECEDVDKEAVDEYKAIWVDVFISDDDTNSYWETLRQYGRMKRSNIETFLHAFAVAKGFFNPAEHNMSDLSSEYRIKISKMDIVSLDSFLVELHDYAEVFEEYFSDEDETLQYNDYISRAFNICSVLEVSTFYPYLLKMLYTWKKDPAIEDEVKKQFFQLERYVILNAICKGSTKNYNNECRQLVVGTKTPKEIMESSNYITEDSFFEGLRRMTSNKLPTLILFWLELYIRDNSLVDLKGLKYEFTLEHIMPQKWAQNWQNVPAYDKSGKRVINPDEIDRIRGHAIYEIGNMTLLNSKLNSSISNSSFQEKVNGKNGKKGIRALSDLKLTRNVIDNHSDWNELKIYKRTEEFEQMIRIIWDAENLPKETAVKQVEETIGRKDLRLKFWKFALPIIREKNDNESYGNVNPTISNEAYGFFGIGGFKLACVANYDEARVDFLLAKNDIQINKEAFDVLFSHRAEIEEKVGATLNWDRSDEYKSSWINIRLAGVSITNEDDWLKMAEFMGEWSAKLRRTLVPYLSQWDTNS